MTACSQNNGRDVDLKALIATIALAWLSDGDGRCLEQPHSDGIGGIQQPLVLVRQHIDGSGLVSIVIEHSLNDRSFSVRSFVVRSTLVLPFQQIVLQVGDLPSLCDVLVDKSSDFALQASHLSGGSGILRTLSQILNLKPQATNL